MPNKPNALDALKKQLQGTLRDSALKDVRNVALLSGGAMAALRGGQGLFNLLSRSGKKLPNRAGISPLPVQYRSHMDDEEEKQGSVWRNTLPAALVGGGLGAIGGAGVNLLRDEDDDRSMLADALTGAGVGAGAGFGGNIAGNLAYDNDLGLRMGLGVRGDQAVAQLAALGGAGLGGLFGGGLSEEAHSPSLDRSDPDQLDDKEEEKQADGGFLENITTKGGFPWYYPAMLTAGVGGGYGGWKLIDKIMDSRRRQELDDEVEDARKSFQEAMSSQYKTGSDSELGTALDELFGKLQKSADGGIWDRIKDTFTPSDNTIGKGIGMYGTYAIPTSILGYLAVKGLADKGSTAKKLEKAKRNRALKSQRLRPAELYAIPSPIEEEE